MTDNTNGFIYIGKHQTKDLSDNYMGSGKLLMRAVNKRGVDKFTKNILFVFDTELEMNLKEQEIVTPEFLKRKDVYNLCEGGKGGWGYINENGLHKNNEIGYKANIKNMINHGDINGGGKASFDSKRGIHSPTFNRSQLGERNHNAKLNIEQVRNIRELLIAGKSNKEIGLIFNVNHSTISAIKLNKSWKI